MWLHRCLAAALRSPAAWRARRKESLEAQMTSIEQDIYLLERGPVLVMQD